MTCVCKQTSFTCDLGYVSSLSPIAPYYKCKQSTSAKGQWSSVKGTCNGILISNDCTVLHTRTALTLCPTLAVISSYCSASAAPSVSNANWSTPQTQVTQQTNLKCSFGYISSGDPILPYYTCNAFNSTSGQWSAVTFGCIRMHRCSV